MKSIFTILTIIFLLCLYGCKNELPDRQELIDKYYVEKESEFINRKTNNCKNEAIAEAQVVIDSLLHNWVNANLFDTLDFPTKPLKPNSPGHIIDKVSKFEVDK